MICLPHCPRTNSILRQLVAIVYVVTGLATPLAADEIDFERDVATLLEQRCLRCHGEEVAKGGFSLATREAALKGGESGLAIASGKPDQSLVLEMVSGIKPAMPQQGRALTAAEVGVLRRWIEAGAAWPAEKKLVAKAPDNRDWWSLQPVRKPAPPEAPNLPPNANPIDAFIQAKLAAQGLTLSPPADQRTLLRRLSLDLWGLPPTPEEVRVFANSKDPLAYEKYVDERLASLRFGERYAAYWLDLVRFAETHGFEMNQERPTAWHYRDYVIRAFHEDLPYNRFIEEQIAGDVLGVDEATGYLVAGPWDQVKSPDPVLTANQRADELHDIVSATGLTFLGLTVGCARCHDHKFDPVPQTDYYALKAIFEGVQHGERPLKSADSPERLSRLQALQTERTVLEAKLATFEPLASVESEPQARRSPVTPRTNIERFAPMEAKFLRFTILQTTQLEPCIDELEIFTAAPMPRNVALASSGAKASASGTYPNAAIHKLEHINDGRYGNEWSWISNETGRGWVQIELADSVTIDRVRWGRDQGQPAKYDDRLATKYRVEVSTDGNSWKPVATSDDRMPRSGGTPGEQAIAEGASREEFVALQKRVAELNREISSLATPPKIYAGQMTSPGATHRLHRGDPTQPREAVPPGGLSALTPKLDLAVQSAESDRRLALARWIANEQNPLTARVIVNRIWQWHFGEGIVTTPSDFGVNGALPTHPELLDWLAAELMEHGWRLKHIHRLIVTSATYRQASRVRAEGLEKDAGTRFLWRFPPRRLEAEPLRDMMLLANNKLQLVAGGPGFSGFEPNANYVRVYTPKARFAESDYRRMIYMTRVRMQVDPVFGVFDCPDGGQATAKRSRSTTPLQALNLLNSSFVWEQSEAFAERLKLEFPNDEERQIRRAFEILFQREPAEAELAACHAAIKAHGLSILCRSLFSSNEFAYLE